MTAQQQRWGLIGDEAYVAPMGEGIDCKGASEATQSKQSLPRGYTTQDRAILVNRKC